MKAHLGSIICFFCVLLNVPGIISGNWWSLPAAVICAAFMLGCFHYEQETIKIRREIAEIDEKIRRLPK